MLFALELGQKLLAGYAQLCRPLCKKWDLPQTALDILLFLANNPECTTARDIVELRGIKANLVSIHVERLVRQGYLIRQERPGDRRSHNLVLTEQAAPLVAEGRAVQQHFYTQLFLHVPPAQQENFSATLRDIDHNLNTLLEGVK